MLNQYGRLQMRNINNTLKLKCFGCLNIKILTRASSGQPKAARFLHSQKIAPLLAAADAVVMVLAMSLEP